MTIMTIRIPDDVKEAFDKIYEGKDKDTVIAELIRRDLEGRVRRRRQRQKRLSATLSRNFASCGLPRPQ